MHRFIDYSSEVTSGSVVGVGDWGLPISYMFRYVDSPHSAHFIEGTQPCPNEVWREKGKEQKHLSHKEPTEVMPVLWH